MSTEGEKRCPLCAEEMDWTDQQFKPCKCGYQVCVWCWHHLIDMAEKDATEGRCPACRAVYEKEKIVAMQADCERAAAAAAPCNKKSKPPKAKPKPVEVKKDLTTVRVIQRKMAYVIGLPNSLADEDILRRKEYFGQYGKITKISLSRTAGGAIQQFINDTCSIYVTYSSEEEAVRCIHSVHGFVLEGRFLRASFGTAKYCHAWLRNMPCSNPTCLYLHTMGADEDSFGKDEAASVHTRNRVQEVAGASSNILKRSGNVLPPPIDELADSTCSSLEKSIGRSSVSDPVHGDHSTDGKITFVDIVGRPSSKGSVKYESSAEDRRILDLCSDQSSATKKKDISINALLYEVPSAGHLVSRIPRDRISHDCDELVREDVRHDDFSSNESSNMTQRTFHSSSNSTRVSEDSSGHTRLHQRTHSSSSFSIDQSSVHSLEDEASLPFTCVKSVLNDQGNELKFQTSAKADRIYRSSNSFSNEEIVEHLRRIGVGNATYDDEKCALDAVESSIISNIMSIDLDSLDDALTLPHGLTELLDETDDQHGSSWDSYTSRESGFSFSRPDGFAGASFESPLNNLGQVSHSSARDHYFSNSQHQAQNPPCLAPPGFSLPQREAPPGFSAYDRTARYPLSSSGSFLNVSSPPNSYQMPPSGLNTRLASNQGMGGLENDSRRWHVVQQESNVDQASQYSQFYGQQTAPQGQMRYPGLSNVNDAYGYPSSRSMDQHQTYDPSYGISSQQKFGNVHMSSGYPFGLPEAQRRSQVGVGTNNYYSGYGDSMFQMTNSGDVYTKVFGM